MNRLPPPLAAPLAAAPLAAALTGPAQTGGASAQNNPRTSTRQPPGPERLRALNGR